MRSSLLLLVLALLCVAFVGCGNDEEYPPDDNITLETELGKADSTCTVRCTPCPPTAQRCNTICVNVGNCHAACPTLEICNIGFVWSEQACRCLPDVP